MDLNNNNIDSMIRSGFKRLLEEFVGPSKEEPINRIKSDYQKNLEGKEWKFMKSIEAGNNALMDFTKDRNSFRLLRVYCERFYKNKGKEVRLERADDDYGERIPPERKVLDVYTRDMR